MNGGQRLAPTLMVQGTSSSSGKSLLVTALCRIFARRGLRVAPFKAQNMSNNAAVCPDGSEIGRAQAVQAMAAGIEPSADMNPILLKPEADARSQVVLNGRAWRTLSAREYYLYKSQLWSAVCTALDRLRAEYELVIIEGAGSPVELNLKAGDLVNMAVARYAASPVVLIGDIDRGGIFAQLLGTLWLLPSEERALVRGLVVNKFRGDLSLFADGVRVLEERGGVPVLGVVPFMSQLAIPDEDAVAIEDRKYLLDEPAAGAHSPSAIVDIAVIKLPHIANFDDFDALVNEAGVRLRYVTAPDTLGQPQAVILPGTKSTLADLSWLREQGLADAIQRLATNGVSVVGICGGYQMLGQLICDPEHCESQADTALGLGLLPLTTIFSREKATHQAEARAVAAASWLAPLAGQALRGYEIHMGRTTLAVDSSSISCQAWLHITRRSGQSANVWDGAISNDGRVWGCYLHGLFDNDNLRWAWLRSLGWDDRAVVPSRGFNRQAAFDRLADVVEAALDTARLEAIIWGKQQ